MQITTTDEMIMELIMSAMEYGRAYYHEGAAKERTRGDFEDITAWKAAINTANSATEVRRSAWKELDDIRRQIVPKDSQTLTPTDYPW